MRKKVVFLDRDGVCNEIRHDEKGGLKNYVNSVDDFIWLPGAKQAIMKLLQNDYFVCIVSNQAGIGYGYMSKQAAQDIMTKLHRDIWALCLTGKGSPDYRGYNIVSYICPHTPEDGCSCRKPEPGSIYAAACMHELCLKDAWMVGDSITDIQAGSRAGIWKLIRIDDSKKSDVPEYDVDFSKLNGEFAVMRTLKQAVDFIIDYDSKGD